MTLLEAIRADDPTLVAKALRRVKDINKSIRDSYPPLLLAAKEGKMRAMETLLDAGADPLGEKTSSSALYCAANAQQPAAVALLLARARYPVEELSSAAYVATRRADLDTLELLHGAGADLQPCLQRAVQGGLVDVVGWLLQRGVDARSRVKSGNDSWCTLLHTVLAGAEQLVPMLTAAGIDINARDSEGRTPLMEVAGYNHARDLSSHRFATITALLANGADATLLDGAGNDALFLLQAERLETHLVNDDDGELARNLDTAEAQLRAADARGGNPADFQLLDAIRKGDAQTVRDALAAGACPDVRKTTRYDEHSALAMACGKGNTEIVRMLLDAGADINDGGRCDIPIARAAHSGHLEVVKLLLERGADVNRCVEDKKSNALTCAKYSRNLEMIDYLRSVGARLPDEVMVPFEPGVDFPDTFTELLVKADVNRTGEGVADALHGTLTTDAWGKRFMSTRLCASLLQYEGSEWSSVLRASEGMGSIVDKGWETLASRVSELTQATAILICHEDTSGCSSYHIYENGKLIEHFEEGLNEDLSDIPGLEGITAESTQSKFFSKRGKTIDREKMDKGHLVLRDLAQAERFRAFNYGPAAMTGKEFDFEIIGMNRRLAGCAFVSA